MPSTAKRRRLESGAPHTAITNTWPRAMTRAEPEIARQCRSDFQDVIASIEHARFAASMQTGPAPNPMLVLDNLGNLGIPFTAPLMDGLALPWTSDDQSMLRTNGMTSRNPEWAQWLQKEAVAFVEKQFGRKVQLTFECAVMVRPDKQSGNVESGVSLSPSFARLLVALPSFGTATINVSNPKSASSTMVTMQTKATSLSASLMCWYVGARAEIMTASEPLLALLYSLSPAKPHAPEPGLLNERDAVLKLDQLMDQWTSLKSHVIFGIKDPLDASFTIEYLDAMGVILRTIALKKKLRCYLVDVTYERRGRAAGWQKRTRGQGQGQRERQERPKKRRRKFEHLRSYMDTLSDDSDGSDDSDDSGDSLDAEEGIGEGEGEIEDAAYVDESGNHLFPGEKHLSYMSLHNWQEFGHSKTHPLPWHPGYENPTPTMRLAEWTTTSLEARRSMVVEPKPRVESPPEKEVYNPATGTLSHIWSRAAVVMWPQRYHEVNCIYLFGQLPEELETAGT